jgi:hypothetical protein
MSPQTRRLADIADSVIPFTTAAGWAGLWSRDARVRGNKTSCPYCHDGGGRDPSFRVYPDHGYCFADCGYYSVTRLLAREWGLRYEEAADKALKKFGWKPPTRAQRWAEATAEPEPDREALARALKFYCAAADPQWEQKQTREPYASRLSECLGLLRLVRTADDCVTWLEACKRVMLACLREQPVGTCLL